MSSLFKDSELRSCHMSVRITPELPLAPDETEDYEAFIKQTDTQ